MLHGFVQRFQDWRSGWGFIVTLAFIIIGWLGVNAIFVFDANLLLLNLCLSMEAAFAMPVLLMAQNLASRADRAKLNEVLFATRTLLKKLDDLTEDEKDKNDRPKRLDA